VSQKATELTSSPYKSALEETRNKRESSTSSGNLEQKQQKMTERSIKCFVRMQVLCEMSEEISEESVIRVDIV
jgi:hypothetical protein